jgi:hypothetical protein
MTISAQIRIGGSQVRGSVFLRIHRSVGALAGSCRITVPGPIDLGAAPGDDVSVSISQDDSEETMFTGLVDSVDARGTHVRIHALDSRVLAARKRVNQLFEDQTSDAIVRNLAGEADVPVGRLGAGVAIKAFWAHDGRSVLGHMDRLAALGGAHLFVDREGKLRTASYLPTAPRRELRHGAHITAISAAKRQGGGAVQIRTEGAASTNGPPAAYWPTTNTARVAGRGTMGRGDGGAELWWVPELRAMNAAVATAQKRALWRAQNTERVQVTSLGILDAELGTAVIVSGIPGARTGSLGTVVALEHVLGPTQGFLTTLRLVGGGL